MEKTQITRKKFEELTAELEYLKTTKMSEIEEAIKVARGHGDLSENSEYDAAKNEQGLTYAKIQEIEATLDNCIILDEASIDTSAVNIGVVVTIENVATKAKMTIQIVGEADASIETEPKRISNISPIGSGLIGHKKGEVVKIAIPSGTVEYKICSISK